MSALERILDELKSKKGSGEFSIPSVWNYLNLPCKKEKDNEITIGKADYFIGCIEHILKNKPRKSKNDICSLNFYSMMPRVFSAWKNDNGIENGTLMKSLCLLPVLSEMGINAIYLLPVFETSDICKKGELSSPYSIKDVMAADSGLHEPILENISAQEEFRAFVEAAHSLNMKVVLDFALRTASRDSVLSEEHPDWFYWIKSDKADEFNVPQIEGIGHSVVSNEIIGKLYTSPEMGKFISCFAFPPSEEEWNRLKEKTVKTGENLHILAKKELGIEIMPGFADTINDPQPPWTDITFLRFYLDQTAESMKYLKYENPPPFIAQDGIKCSVFAGKKPNKGLWDYIEGVIPFYIRNFGIDGARIDMAHALPKELTDSMMKKIRDEKEDFILWSEEFSAENSDKLKNEGYSFLTGGIWDQWDKTKDLYFNEKIAGCVGGSVLPVASALETADTPRAALYLGHEENEAAVFIAALLPNTVVVVNNGELLSEIQPMNLGLKNTEKGRFVLEKGNPLYGKLSFFDKYYFNWTSPEKLDKTVSAALKIREKYIDLIKNIGSCDMELLKQSGMLTAICCHDGEKGFLAIINRSPNKCVVDTESFLPESCKGKKLTAEYQIRTDGENFKEYGIEVFDID